MQQKWNQNFDGETMTDIPQKFLNAGCDVYMVMQLRHDEKILDERFASMRELHRRGKTPDPEHYEVAYYADLPAMWQDVPDNEVLEGLFQMKNKKKACLGTKSAQKPVTSCKSSRNTPERANLIFCWCLCSTVSDASQMKRHLS